MDSTISVQPQPEPEYLYIRDLAVTQCGFRNERQIDDMIVFVSSGGIFSAESLGEHSNGADKRLINLAKFEDGRYFIHDGHHRIASIYLGGRKWLHKEEYTVKKWKYSDYTDISFENKWITPYDPRIEVRIPDYEAFKRNVQYCLTNGGEKAAEEYIRKRHDTYTRERRVLTIRDLIQRSL
jgi:hypothetical protein